MWLFLIGCSGVGILKLWSEFKMRSDLQADRFHPRELSRLAQELYPGEVVSVSAAGDFQEN
jgi:hypothetical protein